MPRYAHSYLVALLVCLVSALALAPLKPARGQDPDGPATDPVDYVDTNIGGIARLLRSTQPSVYRPYGMVNVAPVTPRLILDRYVANTILGFPAGGMMLTPVAGALPGDLSQTASEFDHDLETARPDYYSVWLQTYDIQAEYTVSDHALYYQFTYPQKTAPGQAYLLVGGRFRGGMRGGGFGRRGATTAPAPGRARAPGSGPEVARADQFRGGAGPAIRITGPTTIESGRAGGRMFFVAEFSQPFTQVPAPAGAADQGGPMVLSFSPAPGKPIGVRVGVSFLSLEQARRNLEREMPDWDFGAACAQSHRVWNRALGRLTVTGGTNAQRRVFYTALYRALQRMVDVTEDGQYIGFDREVHQAGAHDYYTNDGLWDTFREMHPLQLLLDPHRQEDMVQSYVRMYEQSGWMPRFPSFYGEFPAMIGHHAAVLIADTYFKGYRNFDVEKAYEGMRKNATEACMLPYRNGPAGPLEKVYWEKGFFPALADGEKETDDNVHPYERRQAVSVTLESCYDDWCVARMAKALGKQADYELFMKRALNYRNVFDARIGFMAPRSADGKWVANFDPKLGGGDGSRAWFSEADSWVYTFHVLHDVAGLIHLMGGRQKFLARLDQLFVEQFGYNKNKTSFLSQFADMTALIGLYAQGNEPSFHIPYLYCYAGQPWKTQQKVRLIMRLYYNDTPEGLPGDDDGGAMSSWYVLSAMGFYPVCPGQPVYVIGSPIFQETRITRADGATFTITARDVSEKNKFIQSAELNGKALNKPWFTQSDMIPGGTLILHMGPRPNVSWGSAPDAAPPSMSSE